METDGGRHVRAGAQSGRHSSKRPSRIRLQQADVLRLRCLDLHDLAQKGFTTIRYTITSTNAMVSSPMPVVRWAAARYADEEGSASASAN